MSLLLKSYLRFILITFVFILCVIYIYVYAFNSYGLEKSENGVIVNAKNAPILSDLIEDNEQGPHQKFVSAESCLVCHKQEINIPGVGKAPKIPHKIKQNCIECHTLQ